MSAQLIVGDAEEVLYSGIIPLASVSTVVTSPPYYALRNYGAGELEIGQAEDGLDSYVTRVVGALHATRLLLRPDGMMWVNLGDTYNGYNRNRGPGGTASARRSADRPDHPRGLTDPGSPNKAALMIPQRVALRLADLGWSMRADVTWKKPAMPETVRDRPRRQTERVMLFTRSDRYAARRPLSRPDLATDVWELPTASGSAAHSARFAAALPAACLAWTPADHPGSVLDPFSGSGTTGIAAAAIGRDYVGVDLSATFTADARDRLGATTSEL
jgi:site-specific DNA-methyltransferase (cytosine-N4-specific)